MVDKG